MSESKGRVLGGRLPFGHCKRQDWAFVPLRTSLPFLTMDAVRPSDAGFDGQELEFWQDTQGLFVDFADEKG